MKTIIQGKIESPESTDLAKYGKVLSLHLYTCTLNKEQKAKNDIPYDHDGNFKIEFKQERRVVQYLVKLVYGEGSKKDIIHESPKLMSGKTHELSFYFEPKRNLVLLPHLQEQIEPHLDGLSLVGLSEGQLLQLASLSMQAISDLKALQLAMLWNVEWGEALDGLRIAYDNYKGEDEDYFSLASNQLENLEQENNTRLTILFALAKGGAADWKQGISLSEEQLKRKIKTANANKWVDIDERTQGVILSGLRFLRDAILLQANADDLFYDAKLLFVSSISFADKSTLLDAALDAGSLNKLLNSDLNDFSKRSLIEQSSLAAYKAELQALSKLDNQLELFPPLLEEIVRTITTEKGPDYDKVYSWNRVDWKNHIVSLDSESKTPNKYKDGNTATDDYAVSISSRLLSENSTPVLIKTIKASKIPRKRKLQGIFVKYPSFKIGKDSVLSQFTTDKKDKTKVVIDEKEMEGIKTFSRVVKLLEDFVEPSLIGYLYENKLTSATQVYRHGKGNLIIDFKKLGYSDRVAKKIAEQVYCKGYTGYRAAVFLASQYKVYESADALVPKILRVNRGGANNSTQVGGLTNMEDLFGTLDYCSCEHCQSVLGPAAYMADLLHWLQSDVICSNGHTGYKPIQIRRPDIGHIQLNCKNTNNVMPYIDLVNEQLAINLQTSPDYSVLQSTWDTEQLLVEPEHEDVLASSYDTLKEATYPLSLPYDALWSHGRGYLDKLGISHAELIQQLTSNSSLAYFSIDWAKAFLGIHESEYAIINEQNVPTYLPASHPDYELGAPTSFSEEYLGIKVTNVPKNLGDLLKAIGISKELFQEIYETKFVANKPLVIVTDSEPACNWGQYTITSTCTNAVMHRLLRFLRLYNLLGITVSQLNSAIHLNGSTKINEDSLIELAGMLSLAESLKSPFEIVLSWFRNSSTRDQELADNLGISKDELRLFIKHSSNGAFPSNSKEGHALLKDIEGFGNLPISIQEFEYLDTASDDSGAEKAWDDLSKSITKILDDFPNAYDSNFDFETDPPAPPEAPDLRVAFYEVLGGILGIETTIIENICETRNTDYPLDFLSKIADVNSIWEGDIDSIFLPEYYYLNRIAKFSDTLSLSDQGLALCFRNSIQYDFNVGGTDKYNWLKDNFVDSNFKSLIWFQQLVHIQNKYELNYEELFVNVDDFSQTSNSPTTQHVYNNVFLRFTDEIEFSIFKSAFDLSVDKAINPKDLLEVLTNTESLLDLSGRLGVEMPVLVSWVWSDESPVEIGTKRSEIKTELLETYSDFNSKAKAITPLHNSYRVELRGALVAYYLNHPVRGNEFESSVELHTYFLLDPEMQACMKTSRIKLAISSIQLLVHRGMMGMESDFCPDEKDKKQWEWQKNYQVWVANKKVFLFPENWIEPELRLDKSSFFQELEDSLLQDEINTENCEKALSSYLTKFKEVSWLDIRAQYNDEDTKVLHVFARTWTSPFVYYYRTRQADKKWTPWEKMEVDIDGNHLVPIVFQRRLYLFFPLFIDQQHDRIKKDIDGESRNAPYLEVKMCYTKLEYGTWTSKKILDGTLLAGDYAGHGVYNNLENKLGRSIPPPTTEVVSNPNYDSQVWRDRHGPFSLPRFNNGEYPDPFSPHGPFKKVVTPGDTYRGNVVFDNENFEDYTKVSLERDAFYFWASPDSKTGNLIIHVRRDFHSDLNSFHAGENEIAYEDSFLINACDERVKIIPAVITEPGFYDKRFLAQPYLTQPFAQQLKKGFNYEEGTGSGLFIKKNRVHRGDFFEIIRKTHGNYVLTYPHQAKDALWNKPFFYSDEHHTYFFERGTEEKCFSFMSPSLDASGNQRWTMKCSKVESQSSKFEVQNHEHPFACMLTAEFNRFGIDGLYDSDNSKVRRQKYNQHNFPGEYHPNSEFIKSPYPKKEYDFSRKGSHSDYNWELLFHIPSLIARQLRLSGKFADSIKWLQFVFDPTNRDMQHGDLRYWKIKPFMKDVSEDSIDNLLRLLSVNNPSSQQAEQQKEFLQQIEDWEIHPFQPHRIASFRFRAYMLWTVMEYVQTLTDWGDMLFKQDSMESINEATQLYIMAGELIGKRPESQTRKSKEITSTFNEISSGLDAFSNIAIDLEDQLTPATSNDCGCCGTPSVTDASLPNLLFCVPHNPKISEIWSTIEDRLFKIRHCMNIDGQIRELPLFQPPIDPALLVKATAMGLDIGSVLAEVYAPDPHYRYAHLLQKANEYTSEAKALGSALLSALEKKDSEELSQLRQLHEQNILKATKNLKKMSIEEAKLGLESAKHSKKLIEIRLSQTEAKEYKNSREQNAIDQTRISEGFMYAEQGSSLVSAATVMIPDTYAGYSPLVKLPGGDKISQVAHAVGLGFGILGSVYRNKASMSSTYANYDRRQEGWNDSKEQLIEELKQVEKQILSAEIRVAIAEKDIENHELQITQSQEIYDYVKNKFTNIKVYTWMSNQLMKLHRRAYELAYDMAKQAERAMNKELSLDDSVSHIQFGNWNSGNRGLLAGDTLSVQLKELDNAYIKNDKRRFELSKDISLRLLDPKALVNLIQHKYCKIDLEEGLLNLVFKSRDLAKMQIKSIGISIPCVTGPHVSTNVKLRVEGGEELITSTGINDMGVFEPNFNQARYMPFEYLRLKEDPADSSKKILPLEIMLEGDELNNLPEYDITTIADVVLHVRYYAENNPDTADVIVVENTPENQKHLLMSWRHDFPSEWQDMKSNLPTTNIRDFVESTLSSNKIPYKLRPSIHQLTDDFGYMMKDTNGKMHIESGSFASDGSLLDKDGVALLPEDVEDIWLLYVGTD